MRSASLALWLLLAMPASAGPSILALNPDAEGAPWVARYSQAVELTARLVDEDGAPLAGRRVSLFLHREGEPSAEFLVADPITGADGVASGRLTLVDGRHGGQRFFGASPTPETPGARYIVRASFPGDEGAAGCEGIPTDAGPADAGLSALPACASEAEGDLFVALEIPSLVLAPGNEVRLGETVDLIATLADDNGNAPTAGTGTDGDEPAPLAGRTVAFFYDADGNGRPSAGERLGTAETNGQGRAVYAFLADPTFVRAQNVESGLHAQFGGDDQYALAGAQQSLLVTPGEPDAVRTVLEVTPDELLADGFSLVELRATLVDLYNNLLGPDDEPFDVRFTASMGTLEGVAERDPLTGQYVQSLKAPRAGGEARVQVFVEGAPGREATVTFTSPGCGCKGTGDAGPLALLALLTLAAPTRRRRRHG